MPSKKQLYLLAALGHQNKATCFFGVPVASYVGMCKVIIPHWFYLDDVDKLTQLSRINYGGYSLTVRRVSHH